VQRHWECQGQGRYMFLQVAVVQVQAAEHMLPRVLPLVSRHLVPKQHPMRWATLYLMSLQCVHHVYQEASLQLVRQHHTLSSARHLQAVALPAP